jgi:hypothetical protein
MILNATTENTAVVTILSYPAGKVPPTTRYFVETANKFGIKVFKFGDGHVHRNWLETKVTLFSQWIGRLESKYEYVLYLDACDVLFLKPLQAICDEFNAIGSPIVMSAETFAYPFTDEIWEKRHPQFPSGFNYPNAGCLMGHKKSILHALNVLSHLSNQIEKRFIDFIPHHYFNDDQILWQVAYVLGLVPMVVDHENRLFHSATNTKCDRYDFTKITPENPVVMDNGSCPSTIHFSGNGRCAIPDFAWARDLVRKPF